MFTSKRILRQALDTAQSRAARYKTEAQDLGDLAVKYEDEIARKRGLIVKLCDKLEEGIVLMAAAATTVDGLTVKNEILTAEKEALGKIIKALLLDQTLNEIAATSTDPDTVVGVEVDLPVALLDADEAGTGAQLTVKMFEDGATLVVDPGHDGTKVVVG